MANKNSLSTVLNTDCLAAGARFRGASKSRAESWFASQANTIGYPYMSTADYEMARVVFLAAAGHKARRGTRS